MRVARARLRCFRRALEAWAQGSVRNFPWRRTRDPYRVLIAELMLRRTRPAQVLPVYRAFLERYPTPRALARAREGDLHRLLAPLGLRWRTRNMIGVARELVRLPRAAFRSAAALKRLPGVGDYVASAVQIMAFGRPETVIDTNVIRVLGRYWGRRVHPEARRERAFKELAAKCAPKRNAKLYTLALLDLGASVCTARHPHCGECPLNHGCWFARHTGSQARVLVSVRDRVA